MNGANAGHVTALICMQIRADEASADCHFGMLLFRVYRSASMRFLRIRGDLAFKTIPE